MYAAEACQFKECSLQSHYISMYVCIQVQPESLTLVHQSCLPGYTLHEGSCICEVGTDSVLLIICDPYKEEVLLPVIQYS